MITKFYKILSQTINCARRRKIDVCRGSGDCNGFCSRCVFAEHKIESIEFVIEDYDRVNYDVFLTKEEAEAKLKELKGEPNETE